MMEKGKEYMLLHGTKFVLGKNAVAWGSGNSNLSIKPSWPSKWFIFGQGLCIKSMGMVEIQGLLLKDQVVLLCGELFAWGRKWWSKD